MSQILEATFRIVTPMFLGGANQDTSDGIRPPSVKGALRFWWRALNWGRYASETSCNESALILLHDEEVRLFGGSAELGGQGCFLLSVIEDRRPTQTVASWPQNNTGAGYLAFGILESGSHAQGNYRPHRQGITEDRAFRIRFAFRPRTSDADIASVNKCVRAWGLFGGLGSRSRRGMGSITLLGENGSLAGLQQFQSDVDSIMRAHSHVPLSPYTSFSKESNFRILSTDSDPRRVLGKAGQTYQGFRRQPSDLRGAAKIPFGLPLQGVDMQNRRGSPLFFHVHALAHEQFAASVLYLPSAVFHPKYPNVNCAKVAEFAGGADV